MKLIYSKPFIFFILWICLLLFTFNRHIRRDPYGYTSEIYADKAGYYVYLPATFIYNWQGNNIPDKIAKNPGMAFENIDNYIYTKYPMGVAVMMSPFWLINHYFIANPNDGFSFSYTMISSVASTFYVLLGLFISFACFKKYTSPIQALIITVTLFASTNLFYYTTLENGMSHSFSFFWFSLLLFVMIDIKQRSYIVTYKDILLIGTTIGFIALIRPINCIFCLPYFLILIIQNPNAITTIKELFFTTKSIFLYLIPIIIISPQVIYYKIISTIRLPYGHEGFPYLMNPRILKVLFAPNNGLFLYTPIALFILLFIFINRKKSPFTIPIYVLFGLVIYTYASWWSTELGCAFGHRSMVEFYTIIFLPLAYIELSKKMKFIVGSIAILSILYNLKLSLSYDICFMGSYYWDWDTYLTLLFSNIK
ncbi:hypothetical protein [uncultured Cytophaga sp.]|uniref:hypothetical protein n=1 Tax=uncultured Cytophaga sp. TaxID=160238 RepID=UPI002606E9C1|nr:hypothetical protein [uncultured Cytophaga sp.]